MSKTKIVEICGPPDHGKTAIAQALATRFGGKYVKLPSLVRADSFTSSLLLELGSNKALLKSPRWWSFITAANMEEEVCEFPDEGLLFVVNYKNGFCSLFKGVFKIDNARDIIRSFPEPDITIVLTGRSLGLSPYESILSDKQLMAQKKFFAQGFQSSKYHVIDNDKEPFSSYAVTTTMNSIFEHCSGIIEKKGYPVLVNNRFSSVKPLVY